MGVVTEHSKDDKNSLFLGEERRVIYVIKDIGWEEKEEVHINIRQIWSLDPILPSPDWTLEILFCICMKKHLQFDQMFI